MKKEERNSKQFPRRASQTPSILKPFIFVGLITGAFPYTVHVSTSSDGEQVHILKFNVISGVVSVLGIAAQLWTIRDTAQTTTFNASSMDKLFAHMATWTINLLGLFIRLLFITQGRKLAIIISNLANVTREMDHLLARENEPRETVIGTSRIYKLRRSAKWPAYVIGVLWFPTAVLNNVTYLHVGLVETNWNIEQHLTNYAYDCKTVFCGLLAAAKDLFIWSTDLCLLDLALVTFSQYIVDAQKKLRDVVCRVQADNKRQDMEETLTKAHFKIHEAAEMFSERFGLMVAVEYVFMLTYLSARFLAYVDTLQATADVSPERFNYYTVRLGGHLLRVVVTYLTAAAVNDEVQTCFP